MAQVMHLRLFFCTNPAALLFSSNLCKTLCKTALQLRVEPDFTLRLGHCTKLGTVRK
jgi:hypothetical protein